MDPSTSSIVLKNKRRGTGRKKIAIQRIERTEYRRVTFAKRRKHVFNRAKELALVCGAEVAIITFSQAGKVYGCANQSVDAIVDRFLTQQNDDEDEATNNGGIKVVGSSNATTTVEEQKQKKIGNLDELRKWLDAPISGMGLHELEQREKALENLIDKVRARRLKLDGSWLSL